MGAVGLGWREVLGWVEPSQAVLGWAGLSWPGGAGPSLAVVAGR
ncbi:hypothetical protein [Amycolatopsis sp. WGS_07]